MSMRQVQHDKQLMLLTLQTEVLAGLADLGREWQRKGALRMQADQGSHTDSDCKCICHAVQRFYRDYRVEDG